MRHLSILIAFIGSSLATSGCALESTPVEQEQEFVSSGEEGIISVTMGCYIDTPRFDSYRMNSCVAAGNQPSVASFQLFLSTTPDYVAWYDHPECTGVECSIPIAPGQVIFQGAYFVLNGVPTLGASARAAYITSD